MFEHTTEVEARKQILDLVADYCDTFHKKVLMEAKKLVGILS